MSAGMKSVLKQPTAYFVLLGVAIFWWDRQYNDDSTIVLTKADRAVVEQQLQVNLGHAPDAAELERGLEVWRENEALYREALALDLLHSDASLRAHLANKLRTIGAERQVVDEPSEATLQQHLSDHYETFRTPAVYDVQHVFLAATASEQQATRTAQVLEHLRAGADPAHAGDRFARGPQLLNKTRAHLEQALGVQLGATLSAVKLNEWYTLHSSRGVHLLRFTRIDDGLPRFEKLKASLRLAVMAKEKERHAQRFVDEVQSQYRFEEEP